MIKTKFSKTLLLAISTALFLSIQGIIALPFNSKLTSDEQKTLEQGSVIIRKTGSIKNMCLKTTNNDVINAIQEIIDLNPAYLAEVIQIRPIKGNEDIIQKTRDILVDIPSYVGIPYWSERHERYFDLYSAGKIVSQTKTGNLEHISAILTMSPIGDIDTNISITIKDDFLLYSNTNLNDLEASGIKCISKKNMKSVIIIFKDGDNWILYGIGGVEAPKIIFLKNRIETSFMNRIKTFCNFVFEKL